MQASKKIFKISVNSLVQTFFAIQKRKVTLLKGTEITREVELFINAKSCIAWVSFLTHQFGFKQLLFGI